MNRRSLLKLLGITPVARMFSAKPCPIGQHTRNDTAAQHCLHCGMSLKQAIRQKYGDFVPPCQPGRIVFPWRGDGKPTMPTKAFRRKTRLPQPCEQPVAQDGDPDATDR